MNEIPTTLIIGYGNELRSDDGIGPRVATLLAEGNFPNARSLALHQLVPELAEDLAAVDVAIFVDAAPVSVAPTLQIHSLEPVAAQRIASHISDPRVLLALAKTLYGHSPQAWLVTVPAATFDLGDRLSPSAQQGIAAAVDAIVRQFFPPTPGKKTENDEFSPSKF